MSADDQQSAPNAPASVQANTLSLLTYLSKAEFSAAANNLFHYPPDYSAKQLSEDQDNVAFSLRAIQRHLGHPVSAKQLTKTEPWISVGTGGGTLPYWEAHPQYTPLRLSVTFSIAGPGYMMLNFVPSGADWKLRSVEFALPPGESNAKLLQQVAVELAERMKQVSHPATEEKH